VYRPRLQHRQHDHAGPAESKSSEHGVTRPPLFSQGEAKVDHQCCPGEGDEQAKRRVDTSSPIDLFDLGVEVFTLHLADAQHGPAG